MNVIDRNIEGEIIAALMGAGCGIVRKKQLPDSPTECPTKAQRRELRDIVLRNSGEPTLGLVMHLTALRTGVPVENMKSERRAKELVRARMIFYKVAYAVTKRSTLKIGYYAGRRDHSTVIHGLQVVEKDRERFEPELSDILAAFNDGAAP